MLTEPQLRSGRVCPTPGDEIREFKAMTAIPNEKGVLFHSAHFGQCGMKLWCLETGSQLGTMNQQVQSLATEGGRGKGLNLADTDEKSASSRLLVKYHIFAHISEVRMHLTIYGILTFSGISSQIWCNIAHNEYPIGFSMYVFLWLEAESTLKTTLHNGILCRNKWKTR